MKNKFCGAKNAAVCALVLAVVFSCASTAKSGSGQGGGYAARFDSTDAELDNTASKTWRLAAVQRTGGVTAIDRAELETIAPIFKDAFTLTFGEKRLSGKGAPNTFVAPYTLGENQALAIQAPASTLMAALREPDALKENEYFGYLSRVSAWTIQGDRLFLLTSDSSGDEALLVFE
jgi:heat shock protein HslJ